MAQDIFKNTPSSSLLPILMGLFFLLKLQYRNFVRHFHYPSLSSPKMGGIGLTNLSLSDIGLLSRYLYPK